MGSTKTYNLLCADMYGEDDKATEKYNAVLVPFLKKHGITKEKI